MKEERLHRYHSWLILCNRNHNPPMESHQRYPKEVEIIYSHHRHSRSDRIRHQHTPPTSFRNDLWSRDPPKEGSEVPPYEPMVNTTITRYPFDHESRGLPSMSVSLQPPTYIGVRGHRPTHQCPSSPPSGLSGQESGTCNTCPLRPPSSSGPKVRGPPCVPTCRRTRDLPTLT